MTEQRFDRGYALVIGVSEYADPAWNAPSAQRDARDLHATLTDPQQSAYPPGQVELLEGEAATRTAIIQACGRLADRSGPENVALISFTGHGALGSDGLYYLAGSDTRFSEGKIVAGSGVSISDLARALRAISARHVLLILNSCASGSAAKLGLGTIAAEAGVVLPEEQSKQVLQSGEGRAILTASRADQLSYLLPELPHSVFGQALIDGLRGSGIAEAGGYIGLFELYNSLHRQVRRAAQRIGHTQEPTLTVVQAAGPFPLARYPGADSVGELSALQRTPASDTASGVRPINLNIGQINTSSAILNIGGQGSTLGDVTIHDVAGHSINSGTFNTTGFNQTQGGTASQLDPVIDKILKSWLQQHNANDAPAEAPAKDPREQLPILAKRLAAAHNVDEDTREDAVRKLGQATRALNEGDQARARQRLGEALTLMQSLGNAYVNSIGRKVAAILEQLGSS